MVEQISYSFDSTGTIWGGGYGDIVVMEDCGDGTANWPSDGNPSSLYSPTDCTGTPLSPMTIATTTSGFEFTHDGSGGPSDDTTTATITPSCVGLICDPASGEGVNHGRKLHPYMERQLW